MIVGAYQLHECLGTGAYSEVYRATREGRTYALKLMKPGAGKEQTDEMAAAMRLEFWVLKDCHHPNLVTAHDFGCLPDGRLYLVEEFLKGETLVEFCRNRSFAECENILLQILDGLAALHGWNVVHGDLKPHNIMVMNVAGVWQAKILDFGLARKPGVRGASDREQLPQDGVSGTLAMLAPEILLGASADARSDLYSLGVTFYEALAGTNPFMRATATETLSAHLTGEPESIGRVRADVPPRWQDFLARLLSTDPERRPASAVVARLQLSDAQFLLVPTRFIGRESQLTTALRSLTRAIRQDLPRKVVVCGESGSGVTRFVREVFYRILAEHPSAREKMSLAGDQAQWRIIDAGDACPKPTRGQDSRDVVTITIPPFTLQEMSVWLAEIFHLPTVPTEFSKKIFSLSGGRPRPAWEILEHLAEKKLLKGSGSKISRAALQIIDWESVLPGKTLPTHVHENFDFVLEELKIRLRRRENILCHPLWEKIQILARQEKNDQIVQRRRAQILILAGACRIDSGEFPESREDLKAALELLEGDNQAARDRIRCRNYLAYIALRQQDASLAIRLYEESAREIEENRDAGQSFEITNLDLGAAYLAAGRHDEAIVQLRKELAVAEGTGQATGQLARLYHLGVAQLEKSEFDKAANSFRRAIELARQLRDGPYLLRALNGLGNVLRRQGEGNEAVQTYGEAMDLALALQDPLAAAVAAQNRAGLLGALGRLNEARVDLDTCFQQMEAVPQRYAYEKNVIARALVQLGELEVRVGKMNAARAAYDRAWHMAQDDVDMAGSRFRILYARCKLAIDEKSWEDFNRDLGKLNHYADDDAKRAKVVQLRAEGDGARTGQHSQSRDPQHADSIEALLNITRELAGDMAMEELLRRILSKAIQLARAELGVLLLVGADGTLNPFMSLNADLDTDLGEVSLSVARQALNQGRPVVAADAAADESFNSMASVMALKLRSILGLPVSFKGKMLGVLYLSHRFRPALFTADTVRLLEAFADLAATAMENNRLLDFHRRAEEQLRQELQYAQADLMIAREQARQSGDVIHLSLQGRELMTRSPRMREILVQAERMAVANISVVLHGESGSGKELMARFLHEKSPWRAGPFIAINCGAIPQNLIESELFGHVKGTFTGATMDRIGLIEAASGGTLFLDEIADLPLPAQVKLLRVLQEREVVRLGESRPRAVNVRVVAASHKSLKTLVMRGEFREDLYYRLAGIELTLPPLRERSEDIPLLASHFLDAAVKRAGKSRPTRLGANMLRWLCDYTWPGNIRELASVVEVGAVLCDEAVLTPAMMPQYLRERMAEAARPATTMAAEKMAIGWYDPRRSWKEHEQLVFASALIALDYDVPRVAKSLGVGSATVYKKMRELRLRELERDWRARTLPYTEGLRLAEVRQEVFAQAFRRHPGHPYRVARELDVAPVTAYRYAPR